MHDDQGNEIAEYDGSWNLQRRLIYDGHHIAPVAMVDSSGTVTYNYFDQLGSVMVVADANGNMINRYAYLPFGDSNPPNIAACLSGTCGSGSGTAFGYAGYRYDPETGLYHAGARYYDPRLGRFIQPDPIGQAGGLNLYAYVQNDPLNATDPSGLFALGGVAATLQGKASGGYGLLTQVQAIPFPPAAPGVPGLDTLSPDSAAQALARELQKPDYTYQTYTRTNPTTGQVYVGRTSGTGDPQFNVDARNASSELNTQGFEPAVFDRSSSSYAAIRGREQQLIEAYGGVGSPGVANKINGISPRNPLGMYYRLRSTLEFGPPLPGN